MVVVGRSFFRFERFSGSLGDGSVFGLGQFLKDFPGGLSGLVLCHGAMPEQADAQADPALARRTIDINYSSAVTLLESLPR